MLFSEIVEHTIGGGWGSDEQSDTAQPVLVVRGADFPRVSLRDTSALPLRYEPPSKVAKRKLRAGDIVLETSGGTKNRPTGRTVFVTHDLIQAADYDLIPASFCRLIRIDQNRADPQFIYYLLQNLYMAGGTWEYQNQSTGIANFQYELFKSQFVVPTLDLGKQRAIARILGVLDEKIAANTGLAATADSWIRTAFSRLASSDDVRPLSELITLRKEPVDPYSFEYTIPYVGLEHIPRRTMWLNELGSSSEVASNKSRFYTEDILFGKLRPYFHKVVSAPVSGLCSTDILVLRPTFPTLVGFALAAVSSDHVIKEVTASSEGTRMPRTSWKDLAAIEVSWPGYSQAESFSNEVETLRNSMAVVARENTLLGAMREAILPDLMSGKLRVKDAEQLVEAAE